jgi:hypothetical protein
MHVTPLQMAVVSLLQYLIYDRTMQEAKTTAAVTAYFVSMPPVIKTVSGGMYVRGEL